MTVLEFFYSFLEANNSILIFIILCVCTVQIVRFYTETVMSGSFGFGNNQYKNLVF